jgi:hypothetical protein
MDKIVIIILCGFTIVMMIPIIYIIIGAIKWLI